MDKYNIHRDFRVLARLNMKLASMSDIHARRLIGRVTTLPVHLTKDLKIHNEFYEGYRASDSEEYPEIKAEIFSPKNGTEPTADTPFPCILFLHGGGFMLGLNEIHYRYASEYARLTQSVVVMPDYRLAPEHPFPYGVEDCYKALEWIYENAQMLGIDPKRIAVVGESAGGNLAAALTLMSRDRKGPKVACQVLVYPATDSDMKTHSALSFTDTPMFYSQANKFMWLQYLKDWTGPVSPYASPEHAESHCNLPPAYIETAEFDPLRDEGIHYAALLKDSDVEVELNQTLGTVHGFDAMKRSAITQAAFSSRVSFLKRYLDPSAAGTDDTGMIHGE